MRIALLVTLLLPLAAPAIAEEAKVSFLDSTIRFASAERARSIIGGSDDWTKSLSAFDRAARVRSTEPVSEEAFLEFAAICVLGWDEYAVEVYSGIIAEAEAQIELLGLELPLPEEIVIVRTSGREEMGSPSYYTRGSTIIVSGLGVSAARARDFFLHELFHVMTRHDPSVREPLYAIIGFEPCKEIRYPEALIPRKLTNPDAYHFDSYVEVQARGKTIPVLLLTLAKSAPYESGSLMQQLTIQLLELEGEGTDMQARLTDGQPTLHAIGAVEGLHDKIGRNTGYLLHPEEIMAENFKMAVQGRDDAPNPEILEAVIELFSRKKTP